MNQPNRTTLPGVCRRGKRLSLAVRVALMAVVALALAAALRFLLVEQPELTWACQSLTPPWWCPLRLAAIGTVRFGLFGFISLVAGLLALWRGGLFHALFAVVCGAAGLILYVPEPAAGGLLLGALSMVRR
jgi:hypothetical protein